MIMSPVTVSMITILLLGAVSMTNSHPVTVSIQESAQNNLKKLLPQTVYPQGKSTLNFKPVPQAQENTQTSVLDVKLAPRLMYAAQMTSWHT